MDANSGHSSSSHITIAATGVDTKWLAVFQCGDFNIGPLNWRQDTTNDQWRSMRGYFQVCTRRPSVMFTPYHISHNIMTYGDMVDGIDYQR